MYLKIKNHKNLLFFVGVLKVTDKKAGSAPGSGFVSHQRGSEDPDLHPDPYQNVTDPEHW